MPLARLDCPASIGEDVMETDLETRKKEKR
jgi:hypothetical protein